MTLSEFTLQSINAGFFEPLGREAAFSSEVPTTYLPTASN